MLDVSRLLCGICLTCHFILHPLKKCITLLSFRCCCCFRCSYLQANFREACMKDTLKEHLSASFRSVTTIIVCFFCCWLVDWLADYSFIFACSLKGFVLAVKMDQTTLLLPRVVALTIRHDNFCVCRFC